MKITNPKFKGKISEGMFRWSAERTLDSKCYLRLYFNHGRIYALVQQLRGLTGRGIRLGAEDIAANVFQMCREDHGLKSVNDFKFLQFIPKESNSIWADDYTLVRFDWDGKRFLNAQWDPLSYELVWRLIGERPPKSLLKDVLNDFTDEERVTISAMLSKCLKEETLPEKLKFSDPSDFYLVEQTQDGLYHLFDNVKRNILYLTPGGELFIPSDTYYNY